MSTHKNIFQNKYIIVKLIGIILVVYVTMEYVLPVIFPFCVGLFIAWLLYPLRSWFERRLHLKREAAGYAAFFVGIAAVAALLGLLGYMLVYGGNCLQSKGWMGQVHDNGELVWKDCCGLLHELTGRWLLHPEDYRKIWQQLQIREFDISNLINNWKRVGGKTMCCAAYAVVAMVSSLLILHDYEKIRAAAGKVCRQLFGEEFGQTMRRVGRSYIRAQLTIMFVITSQCIAGLLVAGERYWLGVGCLIGFCDALPFLGTGICLIPWAIWKAFRGHYLTAGWFMLLYLITSFTRQTLEPRLIGRKIGVPPLAVLFCIYVGVKVYSHVGFLLGPLSGFLIWQLISGNHRKTVGF